MLLFLILAIVDLRIDDDTIVCTIIVVLRNWVKSTTNTIYMNVNMSSCLNAVGLFNCYGRNSYSCTYSYNKSARMATKLPLSAASSLAAA